MRDEVILSVLRDETFTFFIVIDPTLSQPYVRPLKFIELVVSIASIFELNARPSALYFWEEGFVAVCITLHSFITFLRVKPVLRADQPAHN
jgi:hypothetical protein